jgi:sRNA-binding carbon storage regulator CsrA
VRAVRGGKVSLAIKAPADVAIYRLEVWREIVAERRRKRPASGGRA